MAYEYKPIGNDTEEGRLLNTLMVSKVIPSYVEIGPGKFVMSCGYNEKVGNGIKNFSVRDEDIFLAAYPKTGSTWLHEVVYLVSNNFNYNKIKEETQFRLPCVETEGIFHLESLKKHYDYVVSVEEIYNLIANRPNPRHFKTHLQFSMLPEAIRNETRQPKIVVSLRNPYDVCVSFYHHCKLMYNYTGNIEQFCQLFLAGRVPFGPYWEQVKGYWEQRHRSNILLVKYSDMKKDFPAVIRRVANFLGVAYTDEDIAKAADYLSFESMKKNPDLNQERSIENFYMKYNLTNERSLFIRSGKVGGYKTEMSPEIIKKFDAWVEENIAGTGITF